MIDLKRLIGDAANAFDQVITPNFPLLVGNGDVGGNRKAIDSNSVSHLSHFSHNELSRLEVEEDEAQFSIDDQRAGARGIGDASKTVGKVGMVGNACNGNGLFFPPFLSKVGKVGKNGLAGERPSTTSPDPISDEPDRIRDHADAATEDEAIRQFLEYGPFGRVYRPTDLVATIMLGFDPDNLNDLIMH